MPRVNTKLTDKAIREAKPRDKNHFLFDDGGLRLLVRPSGTKVWQYPYKFGGKNNICTIGQYGSEANKVGTAQARVLRDEVKDLLSKGIDPNNNKRGKKQQAVIDSGTTFQRIAEEWFSKQSWNEKHAKNIKSRLEKDVFTLIGRKSIKDATIPDIIQILRNIEERGSITVAQRINQYCVEIFDYAISMSICESNPALGRTKFLKNHVQQNRAHLKEGDLPAFLKSLYSYNESNLTALSIKLLLLTLQRPSEVRNARWEEFNLKEKVWHIPLERMKMKRDHLVPLSKQVLEVLRVIKNISGDCEVLFPSKTSNRRSMSDVSMIKMMKKFSDGKMTPHGVRHMGSTILNERGYNKDWVEKQLSHLDKDKIRGAYNKAEYFKDRIGMMQWWVDYLYVKQKD